MLKDSEKSNGCNGQCSKSWQGEKPAAASIKLPGRMAATTALWFIPLFLTLHLEYQLASTARCLTEQQLCLYVGICFCKLCAARSPAPAQGC